MKIRMVLVIWLVVIMSFSMPIITENVTAETSTDIIFSEAALDGFLQSFDNNYANALAGSHLELRNTAIFASAGQYKPSTAHIIYRGYLSFNTSAISDNERIISSTLNIFLLTWTETRPFQASVYNVEYGDSLTTADWGVVGDYEGFWINSTNPNLEHGQWNMMSLDTNNINKTGRTQYIMNSSNEGTPVTPPPAPLEYLTYGSGESSTPPYLTITTVTETEAVLTYNFTVGNQASTACDVEYWDEHILNRLSTGFEDGTFAVTNWTLYNSPVVTASYAPYEGIYHAGASVAESGIGNHTFKVAINGTGLSNLTLSYYRKIQDVGGGSVSFIADWYNGTAWNIVENLTLSSPYTFSSWALDSSADNNPNLIFRFNMTLTSGATNNGAWIDNAELVTKSGFHQHSNSTIYPSEFTEWNTTAEQLRYEVFIEEHHPTLGKWVILNIDENYTFQTSHPNNINVTNEGSGVYNITDCENCDIFHSFWFLRPLFGTDTYTEVINIFPVEIIDWGTQDLYRYEFWNRNQSWIRVEMPNASFNYESINPYAIVTQLDPTTYNITNTLSVNCFYWIWFTFNKTAMCNAHISLYRDLTGKGIIWGSWDVYINDGSFTNNTTMSQVTNPDILLTLGQTYTISVYDFFPTPNFITNHTFVASDEILPVKVDVPIHPLNLKSFRADSTNFRIWFNALGNPFNDHVPGGEWYQMEVRSGSWMIAIDYMTTPLNGSASIDSTYFFNITINGTYTINIGEDLINIIYTTVSGMDIDIQTVLRWTIPDVEYIFDNEPTATDGTRGTGGRAVSIYRSPYLMITTELKIAQLDNTSGSATLWAGELDESVLPGDILYFQDRLRISAANSSAWVMVNDTDLGTVIINTSAPPGAEFDIMNDYTSSTGHNLSVFVSNRAFAVIREIEFRWEQRINWTYYASESMYEITISTNNTLDIQMIAPEVLVTFDDNTDPNPDTVAVEDLDNHIFLSATENFMVNNNGVSWTFPAGLDSGEQRRFTITYYKKNETRWGTGYIYPDRPPEYNSIDGQRMRYVEGAFKNAESSNFQGDIRFIFDFPEANNIRPETIIVRDLTNNRGISKGDFGWHFTGAAIEIEPDYVGTLAPNEQIKIGVYWLTEEEALTNVLTDPSFGGVPWTGWVMFIGIGLMATGWVVRSSKNQDRKTIGTAFMYMGFVIMLLIIFFLILVSLIQASIQSPV